MSLEFQTVESSNIDSIAFNDEKIYVKFKGGTVYSYDGTEKEFKKFTESESKGRWFHSNLKNKPFEKPDMEKLEKNNT
jgi:hypothetical protein